jgi:hypothetical protein
MDTSSFGIKMRDEYIRLCWPEIEYSYTKTGCELSKTGIDFIDKDYWSGVPFE